ncbi:MAG: ATP-binding cassette domain-containing protein [Rhodococcus sp. (in: high G+C Gram-positive bacteria)]|uniref:energy-coupling factor ABC transporter ATP-binding protein n=1 Tax=Rhodococcus sp. TaxID=1831 RepID=UPI002ADD0952|nr:ATP-binding cassette domain-containing protein [Rhodococcus sp. (in: high G+C Gram-positive bacteria)]
MSHCALVAHDLVVCYVGGPVVLDSASLDIRPAGRLALLGANGSGKTTLLRCLSGALRPDSGIVTLDRSRLRYTRAGLRAHRQNVQLVLQDPDDQLFSTDVEQDVSFGPMNLGLSPAEVTVRVDEALDLLGVAHLRSRPTHQLSCGERKRVATAGAVAMRPSVLLLDEPTAGLDPAGVEEMFSAFERLEKNHTTVVLSTHDVALALDWADSVALVGNGSVVQGEAVQMLSDSERLAAARLRVPWPLVLARQLADDGLISAHAQPRNAAELRAALKLMSGQASPREPGTAV